ncbi:hypothetical protein IP88_08730 [alpha proteobacterium AAP81b]|nr:hypothetical protein IP88_08730 [alpha proteobacterium AAP81b]
MGLLAAGAFLLVAAGAPQNPATVSPVSIVSSQISSSQIVESPGASSIAVVAPAEAATIVTPEAAAAFAQDDDVVARPATLSALVADMSAGKLERDRQQRCLAAAVYFEARGEPLEGQLAVAQSIVNRVESGRFADTVCGVITQPGQYSFRLRATPRDGRDWEIAQAIAAIAIKDLWAEVAPRAVAFHAVRVSPGWRMTRVATIGRHVFYR